MTESTPPENQEIASRTSEDETSINPQIQKGFFGSTIEELKLVVWPTRQQLFSESIAVILMVTVSAASIAAISRFYGWASSQIFL